MNHSFNFKEVSFAWPQINLPFKVVPIVNNSLNKILLIEKGDNKYILKFYHPEKSVSRIAFEHNILNFLQKSGFSYSPCPIFSNAEKSYVNIDAPFNEPGTECITALFKYIEGDSPFMWNFNSFGKRKLISAAKRLAQLHASLSKWKSGEIKNKRGPLYKSLNDTAEPCSIFKNPDRALFKIVQKNELKKMIKIARIKIRNLLSKSESLIRIPIHGDYHPGNLVFKEDRVTGILDFDWADYEIRLLDLAFGVFYFSSQWITEKENLINMQKAAAFIKSYEKCVSSNQAMKFTDFEMEAFPKVFSVVLYLFILWVINEYSSNRMSRKQAIFYLNRVMNAFDLFEKSPFEISEILRNK